MAIIYNSDLSKELVDGAKIQQNIDSIPNQLADKVVPVMEVNPKILRKVNLIQTGASVSTGTVSTGSIALGKNFFLTSIIATMIKDAACDVATGTLNIATTLYETNAATTIGTIPVITLTAASKDVIIDFARPVRLANGASLTLTGTFSLGIMVRGITAYGYTEDNPNA